VEPVGAGDKQRRRCCERRSKARAGGGRDQGSRRAARPAARSPGPRPRPCADPVDQVQHVAEQRLPIRASRSSTKAVLLLGTHRPEHRVRPARATWSQGRPGSTFSTISAVGGRIPRCRRAGSRRSHTWDREASGWARGDLVAPIRPERSEPLDRCERRSVPYGAAMGIGNLGATQRRPRGNPMPAGSQRPERPVQHQRDLDLRRAQRGLGAGQRSICAFGYRLYRCHHPDGTTGPPVRPCRRINLMTGW
jgi:hypothetical protein